MTKSGGSVAYMNNEPPESLTLPRERSKPNSCTIDPMEKC